MEELKILRRELHERLTQLESDTQIDSSKKATLVRENKRFLVRVQQLDLKYLGNSPLKELIVESYEDEDFLIADGFDEAIIGVDEHSMRVIYSVSKCIEILMKDMSEEAALEHFSYNVSGAYVGEKTPIWCTDNLN